MANDRKPKPVRAWAVVDGDTIQFVHLVQEMAKRWMGPGAPKDRHLIRVLITPEPSDA